MGFKSVRVVSLVLSLLFVSTHLYGSEVFGRKQARVYEAFGDSITTGGLAGLPLSSPGSELKMETEEERGFFMNIVRYLLGKIVRALNFNDYSWSGGKKIYSLADFFKTEFGYDDLEYRLSAIQGSTTEKFLQQVRASLKAQREEGYYLEMASVLIGANNYCGERTADLEKSTTELHEGLSLLMEETDAKIIFLTIPDANMVRPVAEQKTFWGVMSCETLWNWSNFYCHRILGKDEGWAEGEVQRWKDRWMEVAMEFQAAYPDRFFTVKFQGATEATDVAVDCFHPSKYGQQRISLNVIRELKSMGFPMGYVN